VLSQEQRLEWLRECLTTDSETLPYRVAAVLVLLYAQPLTKVAALRVEDIDTSGAHVQIRLGKDPSPVPEPFASLVRAHLKDMPNRNSVNAGSPWLFPSSRAGRHLDRDSLMTRLRALGLEDLLGARTRALRDLVSEAPPPVVAHLLGYSHAITQKHAALAAAPMARYAHLAADRRS
jgi:integrase